MLSSALNSERAIQVNIAIMRTFVKLRRILTTHKDLAEKLEAHGYKLKKHDEDILVIFEAIRQLMEPPPEKRKNGRTFILRSERSPKRKVLRMPRGLLGTWRWSRSATRSATTSFTMSWSSTSFLSRTGKFIGNASNAGISWRLRRPPSVVLSAITPRETLRSGSRIINGLPLIAHSL